ncbi:hypothetical protein WS62_12240 [Burkholderia sp. ABCPW 14]|nr:hypothetical protein WS62_12240 [Burkholderia sp. ABCPW 14]
MRVIEGESQMCMTLRWIGDRHRAGCAWAAACPRIVVDAFVECVAIGSRMACAFEARSSAAASPETMRSLGHPKGRDRRRQVHSDR